MLDNDTESINESDIIMNTKLTSGGKLPDFTLKLVGGAEITLGKTTKPGTWQVVFVYRGLHCPLCNKYLSRLEELKDSFTKANAEIVAISGDPEGKAIAMVENNGLTFPVGHGLTIEQMKELGLYISIPRGPQETDRPFAEPGTFAVNADGKIQLIEISNTPFNRADLAELFDTVEWIQQNDYPIRGTYDQS